MSDEIVAVIDQTVIDRIREIQGAGFEVTDAISGEPVPELSGAITGEHLPEGDPGAPPAAETFAGKVFAEQNKPAEAEKIFDAYDPAVAMKAITEKNREVEAAKRDYLASKEETSELKKSYDAAVESLTKIIDHYANKRADSDQPFLQPVPDDENAHERRQRLSEALKAKHCYLLPSELETLERAELDTLDGWLTMAAGVVPPELLTRSHFAGPVDEHSQQPCARCGAKLAHGLDSAFPENAFVGLDCVEPAQKPKKRGKKKHNPEVERAAQQQAGSEMSE